MAAESLPSVDRNSKEFIIQTDTLLNIADAIREVTASTQHMPTYEMPDIIRSIDVNTYIEPISAVTHIPQALFRNNAVVTSVNLPYAESMDTYSFSSCAALKYVNLSALTTTAAYSFASSTALEKVDFANATSLANMSFDSCSSLKTLILRRSASIVTISHANVLSNSGIASGTGYVYVPSSLVDTYKANSVWKTYAAQIRAIEDYPEIAGT